MASCTFCEEPSIGYIQIFHARKKVKSIPVCAKHSLIAVAYQELGQDWIRSQFATVLGIKKGSIPRLKFSYEP